MWEKFNSCGSFREIQLNWEVLRSCFLVSQIMENAEINNIIKIVGLQYKKSYDDPESLRSLRYGKIMIMTDQVSCGVEACTGLLDWEPVEPVV